MYIDETVDLSTGDDSGDEDWNNRNPWNQPNSGLPNYNELQMYIDYSDPLNPGNQINSLGQQIPILSWTHPDTLFTVDGRNYQTYGGNVFSAIAYSWDSGDNFPLFNEKMSIQAQASQDHPNANAEKPSLAPNGNWFDYDQNSYLPALGIFNHVDKVDDPNIDASDAGLNCTHFMLIAKNYNNNPYAEGTWPIGADHVYDYNGKNRTIHGDINLLVPGDLIHLSGHWAIVQSIGYNNEQRITIPDNITCIHATSWQPYWMVQNQQTLWDFFSGWDEFTLERPQIQ